MPQTPVPQRESSIHEQSEPRLKPMVTFTLVHGTFNTKADWVNDDADQHSFRSRMRDELRESHDVRFDVVSWGDVGRVRRLLDNTDACRLSGVRKLAEHLVDCEDVSAMNQRYIVAHSHGGNIVMSALREPALRKKVTGVVCLSTPFLVYKLAKFRRELLFLSCLALVSALWGSWTYAWIYALFYVTIAATIIVTNKTETEASLATIVERRRLLGLAEGDQFPGGMAGPRFVAIRPHRDEVTLLFQFTRGVGTLFRLLWTLLNTVGGVLVFVLIVVGILVKEFPSLATISWLREMSSFLADFVVPPLMILATFVLSVVVVMRWSYAFDAVPWVASMDVRSNIVPWDRARVEYSPVFGWFKHTSIQNQSPPIIARWIREFDLSPEASG